MPSESRKKSGFGGFQPRYKGNIFNHPTIQQARNGKNDNCLRSQSLSSLPVMESEYSYRFQGENYHIPKYEKKQQAEDPWKLETMVEQKLQRTKTSLNFRHGGLPTYAGHIPGYKFRFGESYAALSVRIPK